MSGKIDTIFFATERILSSIEQGAPVKADPVESQLRRDIASVAG